ncbi:hypothetical protein KNE206_35300 [Kitasatospora sp. NE20-6]|uniref:DUF4190 domain-containing protein n=1 Tax=Kitasatospora sp. NE20-6 TaxID=2859066 RepID=UPI0034DC743B
MPSDPFSPQPDGATGQDDAFARAFAAPADPPPAGPPYGTDPYAAPPQADPYAAPQAGPYGAPQAGPYGAPQAGPYGAPPYGAPGAPYAAPGTVPYAAPGTVPGTAWNGWPQAPAGPPTAFSGYAVASLVMGILGGACFMWVGAIAFGIAALRTVRQRNERGRGMAVAGIVLGSVWAFVLAAVLVVAVVLGARTPFSEGGEDELGGPQSGRTEVFELRNGDCFLDPGGDTGDDVRDVEVVSCSEPHDGEVYGIADLGTTSYKDEAALVADADSRCLLRLRDFAPDTWAVPEDAELSYFRPAELRAVGGRERHVTCFLGTGPDTTGSLRQAGSLTEIQTAYLQAEFDVDYALAQQPGSDPGADLGGYRSWAVRLAVALDKEIDVLQHRSWGGVASEPAGALKAELQQALLHVRAAAAADDAATLERELAKADEHLGPERAAALRTALDLTDTGGPVGGLRSGSGAGLSTAAPVADLRTVGRPVVRGGVAAV